MIQSIHLPLIYRGAITYNNRDYNVLLIILEYCDIFILLYLYNPLIFTIFVIDERDISMQCLTAESLAAYKSQSVMNEKEKKEYCLSMANTIFQTLFWSIDKLIYLSWGVSKKSACFYKNRPSLNLKVNGRLHQGLVIVSYDEGHDVFIVYLIKDNVQTHCFPNVYADQLGDFIDKIIEKSETETDAEYRLKALNDLICGSI